MNLTTSYVRFRESAFSKTGKPIIWDVWLDDCGVDSLGEVVWDSEKDQYGFFPCSCSTGLNGYVLTLIAQFVDQPRPRPDQ